MTVDLYQTPLRYGEAYDELSADGVNPRAALGAPDGIASRHRPRGVGATMSRAERRIRENGITYNIYSDPSAQTGPGKSTLSHS